MSIDVMTAWHLACVSLLAGVWTGLLRDSLIFARNCWSVPRAAAVVALSGMTVSAYWLLIDGGFRWFAAPLEPLWESLPDSALHSALALWNALILVGAIRGTSAAIRQPTEVEPKA